MTFPRACLSFLTTLGLLLGPGPAHVAPPGDDGVPAWRDARHELPALVADVRVEVRGIKPADEESPGLGGDGDPVPLPSARPCGRPAALARTAHVEPSHDGRACLAQIHRRVNGSADAHGARA